MRALKFLTGHVIFKLHYNQIYQLKTTVNRVQKRWHCLTTVPTAQLKLQGILKDNCQDYFFFNTSFLKPFYNCMPNVYCLNIVTCKIHSPLNAKKHLTKCFSNLFLCFYELKVFHYRACKCQVLPCPYIGEALSNNKKYIFWLEKQFFLTCINLTFLTEYFFQNHEIDF